MHVFEFLPSGLALLDGEANSASNKNPIGTESRVAFEFNEATISVAIPCVPVCLLVRWWWWWLLSLAGCSRLWGWGRWRCVIGVV